MQQIGGLATAFSEHPLSANTARLIQDDLRIDTHRQFHRYDQRRRGEPDAAVDDCMEEVKNSGPFNWRATDEQ